MRNGGKGRGGAVDPASQSLIGSVKILPPALKFLTQLKVFNCVKSF